MRVLEETRLQDGDTADEEVLITTAASTGWISNSPWWLVSVGIHAVLILGATLVAIEKMIEVGKGGPEVVVG